MSSDALYIKLWKDSMQPTGKAHQNHKKLYLYDLWKAEVAREQTFWNAVMLKSSMVANRIWKTEAGLPNVDAG